MGALENGLVAATGDCEGYSGVNPVRVPHCARQFVRVLRVSTGQVSDLRVRWSETTDRITALAIGIHHNVVTVLVRQRWSDCSYGGNILSLVSWDTTTGRRISETIVSRNAPACRYGLSRRDNMIEVTRDCGAHAIRRFRVPSVLAH